MLDVPLYLTIDKKVGETPLQALDQLRLNDPRFKGVPLTYAGRLDPMASGKLLVLIGNECKKRNGYDGLDKEYEFEILLGVSSDTGDILGLVDSDTIQPSYESEKVKKVVDEFKGRHLISYPSFSSKTVNGKPLFQYALLGKLDTIEIPQKEIQIYEIECSNMRQESIASVHVYVTKNIRKLHAPVTGKVGADFRVPQILKQWEFLLKNSHESFCILTCRARVSSGTYIRALAPSIATALGTTGLTYSIHRSQIFVTPDI